MRTDRGTLRLPAYDYSSPGAYFVTLVTVGREMLFTAPEVKEIAERHWRWLHEHYPYVLPDDFIVMPNHLHAVLILDDSSQAPRKTVGRLIGAYKTVSTQEINRFRSQCGQPVWQRGFYEHVIRDESELNRVRAYIIDNPRRWSEDPHNPDALAAPRNGALAGPFSNGPYGYEGLHR